MKRPVLITWKRLALLPVIGLVGALAVGWSGLVSIAASSGHLPPVGWFLHWTFENAVATQSIAIEVPEGVDLSDPLLVQRTAGHFASGCAPCHGAPGELQSPVVHHMTPPPPRLEQQIGEWRDRELFWIGQHGIKYSGMPAWTTQRRPDEIWALVAFLRALPDMSAQDYARLALGGRAPDQGTPQTLALSALGQASDPALADCARCHGDDGLGVGPKGTFPVIAGQPETYLYNTLVAFASGARESGIMTPAAGIHDDETLRRLAAHYAAQPAGGDAASGLDKTIPPPSGVALGPEHEARLPRGAIEADAPEEEPTVTAVDAVVSLAAAHGPPNGVDGLMALGRTIAEEGLPDRKLAACDTCHGGEQRASNPNYPALAGQPEWYLATHLQLWKDGHRGGTPFAHLMTPIAINMTQEQIDAVSLWYARQPAGR